MRIDKQKAVELRQSGKSYAEISAALGVSKATLSKWFSKESWSEGVRQQLVRNGVPSASARVRELNLVRGDRLKKSYEKAKEEAAGELEWLRYDPLFIAGIMLYWNGGDRTSRHQVRFSTADMEKAKFFMAFLTRSCGISAGKVRASLVVYKGQDEQSNRRFWAFALGSGVKFTKSSVVPGSFDARKLQYGICTLTVSSTYLKMKMQEWPTLLPKRLIEAR